MLSNAELNDMIKELEETASTFSDYDKLANLYIVKEHTHNYENPTLKELNDILPQYTNYCMIKKKFQMNELPKQTIIYAMQDVCKEIKEFIQILYSNTYTKEERDYIKNMLEELYYNIE